MNDAISTPSQRPQTALVWIGRLIAAAMAFLFGMSGVMKLKGGPELAEGMAHLGLPDSMVVPLAVLELTCLVLYLLPWTSVLGAILLTGYLGGAICIHWRVGDPFVVQAGIGVLVWLSLFLRDKRLWKLIPYRSLK
ncbi:DoxX family protein [Gimesia sp.]|uniref:DoxX family protein n=1 Tax=Gimesia sp. TaxID=2024833 RepID=UPI003A8FF834